MSAASSFSWIAGQVTKLSQSLGIIAYTGLQYAMLLIILNIGGYALAGDFTLAQAIATPVLAFLSFSLRPLWVSGTISEQSFAIVLAYRALSSLIGAAVVVVLVDLLEVDLNFDLFLFVLVTKVIDSLSDIAHGSLDREHRSELVGLLLISKSVMIGLCLLAQWLSGASITAITFGFVALQLLWLVAEILLAGGERLGCVTLGRFADLVPFGAVILSALNSFVASIIGFLPRYGLELFADREAVGYFAVVSIPLMVMQMLATGLSQTSLRQLSAVVQSGNALMILTASRPIMNTLIIMQLLIAIALMVGAVVVPQVLPAKSQLFWDMALLSFVTSPLLFRQFFSYLAMATGRMDRILHLGVLALVMHVALIPFFVAAWGMWGVVGVSVLAGFCQTIGFFMVMTRKRKEYHAVISR